MTSRDVIRHNSLSVLVDFLDFYSELAETLGGVVLAKHFRARDRFIDVA